MKGRELVLISRSQSDAVSQLWSCNVCICWYAQLTMALFGWIHTHYWMSSLTPLRSWAETGKCEHGQNTRLSGATKMIEYCFCFFASW